MKVAVSATAAARTARLSPRRTRARKAQSTTGVEKMSPSAKSPFMLSESTLDYLADQDSGERQTRPLRDTRDFRGLPGDASQPGGPIRLTCHMMFSGGA